MGFKLVTLLIVCSINLECIAGSCLCHVVPNFSCPPPPYCCESGMYTFDECGCCLECAKSELQPCGASAQIDGTGGGKCAQGLACLKTCSKWIVQTEVFLLILFFWNYSFKNNFAFILRMRKCGLNFYLLFIDLLYISFSSTTFFLCDLDQSTNSALFFWWCFTNSNLS